ncbi:hypothetical protein [Taibaiella chishuiensis]|uniref:Uncharacterized protein n=1 Tax=Taibaiella chishuiensis TaxID=1434707 RepID=A0A2P8DDA3_9BACT|nr:hypothetical protein [Taibaiella chishuiensis]PSK95211.1 hypothetical protein B0I18_1011377 [Taibaiella chishuiensis]
MKKLKFLGLFLALSLIFAHVTHAQFLRGTTVTRVAGGAAGNASVSLCSISICLVPVNYPAPGSHTFAMAPNDVVNFVIGFGTGGFFVNKSAVDATAGFYVQGNGTNTLLIQKTGLGVYEFFII